MMRLLPVYLCGCISFTYKDIAQVESIRKQTNNNMQSNGKMNRGDREVISIMFGVGVLFLIFLLMVFA